MPNSTKKCLTKSEISKMGPDYIPGVMIQGEIVTQQVHRGDRMDEGPALMGEQEKLRA